MGGQLGCGLARPFDGAWLKANRTEVDVHHRGSQMLDVSGLCIRIYDSIMLIGYHPMAGDC